MKKYFSIMRKEVIVRIFEVRLHQSISVKTMSVVLRHLMKVSVVSDALR